jgi:hypothetical protein
MNMALVTVDCHLSIYTAIKAMSVAIYWPRCYSKLLTDFCAETNDAGSITSRIHVVTKANLPI